MRIVDGHNLIGTGGELGLALTQEDKEERLLRLLARWRSRRRSREPLLVVFDGGYGRLATGPRRYSHAGMDVEWALGETADAVILRRVKRSPRPREIEVVTSDRTVARAAASLGAHSIRSQEFLSAVARALEDGPAPEKPESSTPDEIAAWLERFSGPR